MFERRPDPNASLDLDAKDVRFLRTVVARQPLEEHADVTFSVCPTCASPIWMETVPEGTGQTIALLGECCQRCQVFQSRHPEVFAFITSYGQAARFIQLRLRPKPSNDAEPSKDSTPR